MPKIVYTASKGLVQSPGAGISIERADATGAANAATANGTSGTLTLQAATINTGEAGATQTITNNRVKSSSVVLLNVTSNGSSDKGCPQPFIIAVADGSFTFKLGNAHGSHNITQADVKVSYFVI